MYTMTRMDMAIMPVGALLVSIRSFSKHCLGNKTTQVVATCCGLTLYRNPM